MYICVESQLEIDHCMLCTSPSLMHYSASAKGRPHVNTWISDTSWSTLSRSSALECVQLRDVLKICDRIIVWFLHCRETAKSLQLFWSGICFIQAYRRAMHMLMSYRLYTTYLSVVRDTLSSCTSTQNSFPSPLSSIPALSILNLTESCTEPSNS